MKKVLVTFSALILTFSLVACSKTEEEPEVETPELVDLTESGELVVVCSYMGKEEQIEYDENGVLRVAVNGVLLEGEELDSFLSTVNGEGGVEGYVSMLVGFNATCEGDVPQPSVDLSESGNPVVVCSYMSIEEQIEYVDSEILRVAVNGVILEGDELDSFLATVNGQGGVVGYVKMLQGFNATCEGDIPE